MIGERRSYIAGIGQSVVGRRTGLSEMELTMQSVLAAITDAGLEPADIDGLSTYPGGGRGTASGGFGGPGATEVIDALGLAVDWYSGSMEGAAQLQAVVNGCMAIATGLARHVVVYRTVTESSAQGSGGREGIGASGMGRGVPGVFQYLIPFGATSAVDWVAYSARYHFEHFGLSRQSLAEIAMSNRRHAALNPKALLRDPMSLEDYLAARMIAEPLCLYDCDLPCDGSTALVLSHVDTAPDAARVPVQVHAVGTAVRGRPSWDQWEDLATFPGRGPAAQLWQRADVGPADVGVAQLYDGFSMITVLWLEALGFCPTGGAAAFLEGGARIALDGELPLNTAGGQLSAGRLHGFGLIHEAVVQLRGDGGARQVGGPNPEAQPEVAVVANGAGFTAGCMLLTRGLE
ncbi:MAG: thiolase family protein [Actinomycetota bacterium]|nr:thiolase family protein [Actinomycetota bacterium]